MASDCLFCQLTAHEIPSHGVYEDDMLYAFLDIHPVSKGHTLIVPKTHSRDVCDTTPEILAAVATTIPKIARALLAVIGAPAFNIGVNNGAAAGQIIFHQHWHLIPRWDGDGLKNWPQRESMAMEEMQAIAEKIRVRIQGAV